MPFIELTTDQLKTLRRVMLARYIGPADLEEMLLLQLDRNFQHIAVQGSTYPQNLLAVIRTAQADGWLLRLVHQVSLDEPGDLDLQALEDQLKPIGPPPDVDCFEVCCLTGSRVMVDRKRLRDSLRLLSKPMGKRIMVVTGRKSSGKSHSVQLISYLTAVRGGFSLIPVDLGEYGRLLGVDTPIEPRDVACALVRKLGYDFTPDSPPTDSQWARWVLDFCEEFEARALQDDRSCWVVIDGFGSVVLPQPTMDLIKGIAVRINRSLWRFRLILLGYGDDFPHDVLPQVMRESIEPIGINELLVFFERAYQQLQVSASDDTLVDTVTRVLSGLDPQHEEFLFQLEPRVSDELAEATAQGDGS